MNRHGDRYIVRYGVTRNLGEFVPKGQQTFARNAAVIVRSDRGVEWGEVLCPASQRTREYLGAHEDVGGILREASEEDLRKVDEVRQKERDEFASCEEYIRERKLPMQLVDVEHLFGEERLIFYYLSEKRVTSGSW